MDLSDELNLWNSSLPQFIFPRTHYFPEFVVRRQFRYIPSQREVISQNKEVLFTIIVESIGHVLQVKTPKTLHPFSLESHMDIYKNLDFPQRTAIFETFLPENDQVPKNNPPYQSTMFPNMTVTQNFVTVPTIPRPVHWRTIPVTYEQ